MIHRIKAWLDPRIGHVGITWPIYCVVLLALFVSQSVSGLSIGGMMAGRVHASPTSPISTHQPRWLPNAAPLTAPSQAVQSAPSVRPNASAWYVHNVIVHYENGRSFDISSYVNSEGDKYGVSPVFIAAVMGTESGMTIDVQRWAGGLDNSCGLMQQIVTNVASHIGNYNSWADCQWEMNPYNSIDFGTQILAQDIAYHGGRVQPPQAYVMYNAGAGWPDSFYFYPTGQAYQNYEFNFLPNWNYSWAHYATYAAPPAPTPTPRPAPVFRLSHWNAYRWHHHLSLISPWFHHKLDWAASIWTWNQKLGGIKGGHWYQSRGQRGYTKTAFRHGAIFTWPSNKATKVVWR